jgi:hypothetical protein
MDQDTFLVGNGDGAASFHAPVKKLAFIATHPPDLQQFDGSPARRHPVQDHKSCGRIMEPQWSCTRRQYIKRKAREPHDFPMGDAN